MSTIWCTNSVRRGTISRPFVSDVNDMVYQFGPARDNITPVPNDLWDVIQKYWAHNTVRPSNFYAAER